MNCSKCGVNIKLNDKVLKDKAIKGHKEIKVECKCGKVSNVRLILNIDYHIEGDEMEILPEDYVHKVVEVTKEVVNKPVKGLRKLFRRNKKR